MEFVTLYPGSARLTAHQLLSGEGGSAAAAAPFAASVPPGDARHWEARDYAWNPETITAWPVGEAQPMLPGVPVQAGAQEGRESGSLCQVPGCTVTPEEMRAYNMRCRLCTLHMRAESLNLEGCRVRFCQKCNKLHRLHEFEGRKRTCSSRLAQHNARRRERNLDQLKQRRKDSAGGAAEYEALGAAAVPHRGSKRAAAVRAAEVIRSHKDRKEDDDFAGDDSEEDGNAAQEKVAPAPAKRAALGSRPEQNAATGAAGDFILEDALVSGDFDVADWFQLEPVASASLVPPLLPPLHAFAGILQHQMLHAANVATDAAPAVLHVKLPHATPLTLPAGLPAAFASAFTTGAPMAFTATLRPGCVLLTIDALISSAVATGADAALDRLLVASGAGGDFFRAQTAMSVHAPGTHCETVALGELEVAPTAPRLPPLAPLAALSGAVVTISSAGPDASNDPHFGPLHCRLHGRTLPLSARSRVPAGALTVLEACVEEGCALLDAAAPTEAGSAAELAAAPRPLLLCTDEAIVAEVCAAAAAAGNDVDAREAAERIVCVLGAALRPHAGVSVLAAAAAAAVTLGWTATLSRLLPLLRAAATETVGPRGSAVASASLCSRGGRSLLHRATDTGVIAVCAMVLTEGGADCLFGSPATFGSDGFTPLHFAAAHCDGGALAALLLSPSATSSGQALMAWFRATGASGQTPAQVSEATDGCAEAQSLRAALRARHDAARALALQHLESLQADGYLAPQLIAVEALNALTTVPGLAAADAADMFRAMEAAACAHDSAAVAVAEAAVEASADGAPAAHHIDEEALRAVAEESFKAWQAAHGRILFTVICMLNLVKSLGNSMHCYFTVLAQDELTYASLERAPRSARMFFGETLLHSVDGRSSASMVDLSHERICSGCTAIVRTSLLARLPMALVGLALLLSPRLWAFAMPRYEPIFVLMYFTEALIFAYIDFVTVKISGGLIPEWPTKVLLLRALLAAFCLLVGPFRTKLNRLLWLVRVLTGSGLVLAVYSPLRQRLWLNVGYRTNLILLFAEFLLEAANQRRLRRSHAAHMATALATRKKKNC